MKEIYNSTGCEIFTKKNGKLSVKSPEIGSMINVFNDVGLSQRMIVVAHEGNHICCDNDGFEACVALKLNGDVLLWRDITENEIYYAEKRN